MVLNQLQLLHRLLYQPMLSSSFWNTDAHHLIISIVLCTSCWTAQSSRSAHWDRAVARTSFMKDDESRDPDVRTNSSSSHVSVKQIQGCIQWTDKASPPSPLLLLIFSCGRVQPWPQLHLTSALVLNQPQKHADAFWCSSVAQAIKMCKLQTKFTTTLQNWRGFSKR